MKRICLTLALVSLLTVACEKKVHTPATEAEKAEFVGHWVGHMALTEEQVDETHKMFPEGDRDALKRWMAIDLETLSLGLELKADGSFLLVIDYEPDEATHGLWKLQNSLTTMSLTVNESVSDSSNHKFAIAEDGESFVLPNGWSGRDGPITFHKAETYTPAVPSYDSPYKFAKSGEVSDFVGSWVLSWDVSGAKYDSLRGLMSEEDVQEQIEEMKSEQSALLIFEDMTFSMSGANPEDKGSWTLSEDGSTALLEVATPGEDLEQSGAAGMPDLKMEMRLTEDSSVLAMMDMHGFGVLVTIFRRE